MKAPKPMPKWQWAILAVSTAVGLFWLFGYGPFLARLHAVPFDSEVWKKSGTPSGVNNTRLKMVRDLIKAQPLQGKSRAEITALLGEPDGDPGGKPRFPDGQVHYYLGPSWGLMKGFDYDYLVLRLDDRDKVAAIGVVTFQTHD